MASWAGLARLAGTIAVAIGLMSICMQWWWAHRQRQRVYSVLELRDTTDKPSSVLLLSVAGRVFDVSAGATHYGAGKGYHHFVGKDASRAFVTGDFSASGLTDEISDFTPEQCVSLEQWVQFYTRHSDYPFKGVLAGAFYSERGDPTAALRAFEHCLAEGQALKASQVQLDKRHPRCSSRWTGAEGSSVWCDQPGHVPRQHAQQAGGKVTTACRCFPASDADRGDLAVYEDCDPDSPKCHLAAAST